MGILTWAGGGGGRPSLAPGKFGFDPLVVQFSAGPESTLLPLQNGDDKGKTIMFPRTQDDEGSEGDDSFDDEDDNDGPAIVCSCTLGGPTVVIEAKTDNKIQENTSEG